MESPWIRVEVVWALEPLVLFYFGLFHEIPHSFLEYGARMIG